MSSLSSWVLSICGVSLLSVLIDLFLPDGPTNKHIKNMFSFAILLVMITPLPNLFKGNLNIDDVFEGIDLNIQDDYIYNLNQQKIDFLQRDIEKDIKSFGINNVIVSINSNIFDADMKINSVFVDLSNIVISEKNKNINIKETILKCINNRIKIKGELIIFDG